MNILISCKTNNFQNSITVELQHSLDRITQLSNENYALQQRITELTTVNGNGSQCSSNESQCCEENHLADGQQQENECTECDHHEHHHESSQSLTSNGNLFLWEIQFNEL
jgi:hypothetical protein